MQYLIKTTLLISFAVILSAFTILPDSKESKGLEGYYYMSYTGKVTEGGKEKSAMIITDVFHAEKKPYLSDFLKHIDDHHTEFHYGGTLSNGYVWGRYKTLEEAESKRARSISDTEMHEFKIIYCPWSIHH
jgi:hypothetical protein